MDVVPLLNVARRGCPTDSEPFSSVSRGSPTLLAPSNLLSFFPFVSPPLSPVSISCPSQDGDSWATDLRVKPRLMC